MYIIQALKKMLVVVLERIPELDLVRSTVLLTKKSHLKLVRVLANCLDVNVQFGVLGMWMTLNGKFDMPCALSYDKEIKLSN